MARKVVAAGVASASKEESKVQAAAEASSRRSKGKKLKSSMKYYTYIGIGVVFSLFALWLILTGESKGGKKTGGTSRSAAMVNERSFVRGVMSDAAGNFTAAASPFFDRWSYADVKYGLDGVALHGAAMVGMAGALQHCEQKEGLEGGVLPPAYDVREAWPGCMGKVYDSQNCSSSYAIAAATSLSARFCIADNAQYATLQLSPQQILSCDKKSRGCKGGGADSVWGYIQRRGLYPEECVPFAGEKATPCKTTCEESKKLKAIEHCLLSSEKAIKREIFNRGPVVVPLHLNDDFLVYEGGVYTPTDRAKQQYGENGRPIIQAVTVLGWGRSEGTRYWIVGNSWGTSWGEQGFARVAVDTVLNENYALVGFPATEEAIAEQAQKQEEEALRREEAKKERAAREERIKEQRLKREAEERAAREAADTADLDDDFEDEELSLDDVDDSDTASDDPEA